MIEHHCAQCGPIPALEVLKYATGWTTVTWTLDDDGEEDEVGQRDEHLDETGYRHRECLHAVEAYEVDCV